MKIIDISKKLSNQENWTKELVYVHVTRLSIGFIIGIIVGAIIF